MRFRGGRNVLVAILMMAPLPAFADPEAQPPVNGSASESASLAPQALPLEFEFGSLLLHPGAAFSVAYAPDGGSIAVGDEGGAVKLIDSETGQIKQELGT